MALREALFVSLVLFASEKVFATVDSIALPIERSEMAPLLHVNVESVDKSIFPLSETQERKKGDYLVTLTNYYRLSKEGRRSEVLQLYSPNLRKMIASRYVDDASVAKAVEGLVEAKIMDVLYWGKLRFVLVEHKSKGALGGQYEWMHVLDCSAPVCLFSNPEESTQVASYSFYLRKMNKQSFGKAHAKKSSFDLYPIKEEGSNGGGNSLLD